MYRLSHLLAFGLFSLTPLLGQTYAQLQTSDTLLQFAAGSHAPELIRLQSANNEIWTNCVAENLPTFAECGNIPANLTWQYNPRSSHVDENGVEFVYECASPRMELTWKWLKRADFGPLEHTITIANLSSNDIWIPFSHSFVFDWQVKPTAALRHFYIDKGGGAPTANGTHFVPITNGYTWTGKSSPYAIDNDPEGPEIIPWFMVMDPKVGGSGWYIGVEFSGCTRLTLAQKGNSLHGTVGLDTTYDKSLPGSRLSVGTHLSAGATLELPKILLGGCLGDPDSSGNILRQWVRKVLADPRAWADPHYPLLDKDSWGSGMEVSEATVQRMIARSADLGLEMFHLDAGWFRGVGDWYPDPQKFPHGIAAIASEAHMHGLKFGLWVDWTQAGIDTFPGALSVHDPLVRSWLVHEVPSGWKPEAFKGMTIDIGEPGAQAWAEKETNRIVDDYKLDLLEHDGYLVAKNHTNVPLKPQSLPDTPSLNSGSVANASSTVVSFYATRAYYAIQDRLRLRHPELLLEICNDGGRMVDFGSATHGDYFSITDSYDPTSNRRAFYDASYILPSPMLECYVAQWPTPTIENLRYMLRSGMMGWFTAMLDTRQWTQEQAAAAKTEFEIYKTKLRPFIRDADLYHISPRPDGIDWDGLEYFDPRRGRGVVYIFRGTIAAESSHAFSLRGLVPGASYRLHFQDGSSPDRTVFGSNLVATGLKVNLPHPNSSELVFFDTGLRN